MASVWKHQITIACPDYLISDANQLALYLGTSPGDINTYSTAKYADTNGNLYSVACTRATAGIFGKVSTDLPEQTDDLPDMEAVGRALSQLVIWDGHGDLPAGLVALVDIPPADAIAAMGLALVEIDEA